MLELDSGQEFDPARDEEFFASLPERPGVLLLELGAAPSSPSTADAGGKGKSGGRPYIARTADLRRAARRLLGGPEGSTKRLNLRGITRAIRYRVTASRFEQLLALYLLARQHFPRRYRNFLRLRPPVLLKVNLRNEYPRCYITRRIFSDGGFYLGPFPSRRAAESFAGDFLDLFKIRRCQIKIRRDPSFPGCIYSEMKMCLAPCFAGCTKAEYDAEVARVVETLDTAGAAMENSLAQEREAASGALDYERAASIHKKLEKVSGVLRGLPELARRVDKLDAVILQRAPEENAVAVFYIRAGLIAGTFPLCFGELSSEPRSVEAILRDSIAGLSAPSAEASRQENVPPKGGTNSTPSTHFDEHTKDSNEEAKYERYGLKSLSEELGEHLSLLARWYFSKPREGEIFFPAPDWPYRRMIRACARILSTPAG